MARDGMIHPDVDLVALVTGDLTPAEQARVAAHLEGCAICRRAADDYRTLLHHLARTVPSPPPVHWGRFRVELAGRREAGKGRPGGWDWSRSLQGALSVGLAALLVVVAIQSTGRHGPGERGPVAATGPEEGVFGSRFDLLRQYPLVERLDLLENLDVIGRLDELEPADQG